MEQVLPETGTLDPLQELLRDDLVGVDVDPRRRLATIPVCTMNGCMVVQQHLPHVDQAARDGRRGRHGRTHQVRSHRPSLPTLEVPVGGGRAALAAREHIVVHAQAHGAAALRHSKPAVAEDPVEPFPLRLPP